MANFIRPNVDSVTYLRGAVIENHPVNIDRCKRISKARENWYPDNTGKPAIKFHGCDCKWVFDTDEERDQQFDEIVSTNGK